MCGTTFINLTACRQQQFEIKWLDSISSGNLSEEQALNRLFLNDVLIIPKGIYTFFRKREKILHKDFLQTRFFHLVGRKPCFMSPFMKFGIRTSTLV